MSNELIDILYKNKKAKAFCLKNALSEDEILRNYSALSKFKDADDFCEKCDGKTCLSSIPEMTCHLQINSKRTIEAIYEDCLQIKKNDPGNFEVIDFNVKNVDLEITTSRIALFSTLEKFSNDYYKNGFCKGLYLYGKCGTGKSLLLYKFAQGLVAKGTKVLFAYYPDLVRRFQSSFGSIENEELILKLKTADILILDDIGREANSPYIRDSILGPILQYRCDSNLPMFMTSNRDFNLIAKHLSETSGVIDNIKAEGLISRLKYLMKEYKLEDKDFRNN